ncbi:hypothetical protein CRYUN_Cryun05aG0235600 [Craigia yunnanensis]
MISSILGIFKEVYKLSIGAACGLSWPSHSLIVQVLDDSTNEVLRELVEIECRKWIEKGVNVKYETRNNRNGYKAGALKEGLKKQYVKDSTPGVWRIQAINDAGGWKDRTTVEDMDLAVRASLKGWKFVFVGDLAVRNELPSTFKAYRYQQHRWSCGPANLFRKMTKEIMFCKRVSIFMRMIIAHWVTFFFYCIVIPTTVLVPEVHLTKPIAIYIPATITILNAVCTPR